MGVTGVEDDDTIGDGVPATRSFPLCTSVCGSAVASMLATEAMGLEDVVTARSDIESLFRVCGVSTGTETVGSKI